MVMATKLSNAPSTHTHICGAVESGGWWGWGVGMHWGPPSGPVRTEVLPSRTSHGCMFVCAWPAHCLSTYGVWKLTPASHASCGWQPCRQATADRQPQRSCRMQKVFSAPRASHQLFRGHCCCPGPCTALEMSVLPRSPGVRLVCGFLFSGWCCRTLAAVC
jgi:hypothetical protein